MGDSDEEMDHRRPRDKFRRERNEPDNRYMSGGDGGYVRHNPRGGMMGGQQRYGGGGYIRSGDRGPMAGEPLSKRPRPYDSNNGGDEGSYRMGSHYNRSNQQQPPLITQPPLRTLKQFLSNMDDNINDEEALQKYRVYKEEFARRQLDEFFQAHKNEPWFIEKFHPNHYAKRLAEFDQSVHRRLEVFMKFYDKVDGCRVHIENQVALMKFLDTIVIVLEGGSEADLPVLEDDYADRYTNPPADQRVQTRSKSLDSNDQRGRRRRQKAEKSDGEKSSSGSSSHSRSASSSSRGSRASGSSSDSGSHSRSGSASPTSEKNTEKTPMEKRQTENVENTDKPAGEHLEEGEAPPSSLDGKGDGQNAKLEPGEKPVAYKPKPYHLTNSLFLRNLSPHSSRQAIEDLCRKYEGFIRLALADPQPDRKFYRRGWATYSWDTAQSIKEICWNINNVRLQDTDIGAIVNRPLSQRVRPVIVLANHRTQMRQDIKFVAKLVQKLDARQGLWKDAVGSASSLDSGNPLMRNITDFLVEEGSYEEEAFLGGSEERNKEDEKEITLEEDAALTRVLDRLILYLRVVHSVDYYSASEYPGEDEMPHRCGVIHARGANIHPDRPLMRHDLEEYSKQFEVRILRLLDSVDPLSDVDCQKLGLKDPEAAVEAFMKANIQELAPEKWLCPLSGKKFKGPDFVRKHILNKHMDKVDAVRNEVLFYNNYIRDPRRPQLPPHPVTKAMYSRSGTASYASSTTSGYASYQQPQQQRPQHYYSRGGGGYTSYERGGDSRYDRFGRRSPTGGSGGGGGEFPRYNGDGPPRRYNNNNYYREDSGGGRGRGGYYNRGGFDGGNRYGGFMNNRPREMGGMDRGGRNFGDRPVISYNDLDAPVD